MYTAKKFISKQEQKEIGKFINFRQNKFLLHFCLNLLTLPILAFRSAIIWRYFLGKSLVFQVKILNNFANIWIQWITKLWNTCYKPKMEYIWLKRWDHFMLWHQRFFNGNVFTSSDSLVILFKMNSPKHGLISVRSTVTFFK